MSVNRAKATGNMYPGWDTWNILSGCLHDCEYCYAYDIYSRFGLSMSPAFRESYLKDNLGHGRHIFISSMGDIGGDWVDPEQVKRVLVRCCDFDNTYLLQSKNPANLAQYIPYLPERTVIGTTLETNRDTSRISKAPPPSIRAMGMVMLRERLSHGRMPPKANLMISIEPILAFDDELIHWIRFIQPEWVSIGADSKNNHLGEPSPKEIYRLIRHIREMTQVRLKPNLRRLLPEHDLY